MGNCFVTCVSQASIGVVERWGRFERLAEPGLHFFNPFAGECLAAVISTRICSLDVRIETKTKDNVFVQLQCSIQYRVVKENADDAYYELQNPKEQIRAFVFDVVRAIVPRMTLDELFEQKGEVAQSVLEELEKVMVTYGYNIEHMLMVDIVPDSHVRTAMNEINKGHYFYFLLPVLLSRQRLTLMFGESKSLRFLVKQNLRTNKNLVV
uniref:Band 7 domain-containing protein n=1 Tax=Cannabis sativa TaxID=3483 RepID=A0A803QVT3_CANSA